MRDNEPESRTCAWCGEEFSYAAADYCSVECQSLARNVQAGNFPVRPCPRCERLDLRIESPTWGICQTCGWQPDTGDMRIVQLTPRGSPVGLKGELRERYGSELFASTSPASADSLPTPEEVVVQMQSLLDTVRLMRHLTERFASNVQGLDPVRAAEEAARLRFIGDISTYAESRYSILSDCWAAIPWDGAMGYGSLKKGTAYSLAKWTQESIKIAQECEQMWWRSSRQLSTSWEATIANSLNVGDGTKYLSLPDRMIKLVKSSLNQLTYRYNNAERLLQTGDVFHAEQKLDESESDDSADVGSA